MNRTHPILALALVAAVGMPTLHADDLGLDGPAASPVEGIARPSREVTLESHILARLAGIEVEEAEAVEAGRLLVQLDDDVQAAAVARMRLEAANDADIRRLAAAAEEARQALERTRQLYSQTATTEWELTRAQLQHAQAEAAFDAAKEHQAINHALLELEERRLAEYRVVAPFSGHVLRLHVEEGATLSDEDPVVTLAQLDPLEAELYLPAELYEKVRVGEGYRFLAESPVGRELVGTLKTRTPSLDSASHTFRCVFSIPNPDARMPANFKVRLLGEAAQTTASLE